MRKDMQARQEQGKASPHLSKNLAPLSHPATFSLCLALCHSLAPAVLSSSSLSMFLSALSLAVFRWTSLVRASTVVRSLTDSRSLRVSLTVMSTPTDSHKRLL